MDFETLKTFIEQKMKFPYHIFGLTPKIGQILEIILPPKLLVFLQKEM